jgi:hypothetical protein
VPPLHIPEPFKRKLAKKTIEQQGAILECVQRLGENPVTPGYRPTRFEGVKAWSRRM